MPVPAKSRKIPPVDEIAFPLQLTGLRIHEVSAQRTTPEGPPTKGLPLSIRLVVPDTAPKSPELPVIALFETTVPGEDGRACKILLSLEGIFQQAPDAEPLPPATLKDFQARHALVLIWPYLRQYLFDLTTKLGLKVPPLPVVDPRALIAWDSKPLPKRSRRPTAHPPRRSAANRNGGPR